MEDDAMGGNVMIASSCLYFFGHVRRVNGEDNRCNLIYYDGKHRLPEWRIRAIQTRSGHTRL